MKQIYEIGISIPILYLINLVAHKDEWHRYEK